MCEVNPDTDTPPIGSVSHCWANVRACRLCLSCRCPLLGRVWKADLEACQLLMQSLQLQEVGSGPHAEDEKQVHSAGEAAQTAALAVPRAPHPEEEKSPVQVLHEWDTHAAPSPHRAAGPWKEVRHVCVALSGVHCVCSLGIRTNRT